MNPSPFARNSFWIMLFGFTGVWLSHISIHPGMVQRYLALPTEKDAKHGVLISSILLAIIKLIIVFAGLIIYAKYYDCDPIRTKSKMKRSYSLLEADYGTLERSGGVQAVKRADQITPYFVMDVAGHLQGLPGLFMASLATSALAVMSTNLNTMSGTIYEDFVRPWLPNNMQEKDNIAVNFMKAIGVICGMITVSLVFLIEKLGTVFEMGVTMHAISGGPLLGLFFLGIMVPWANAKGALVGGSFSLVIMSWLAGCTQWNVAHGKIQYHPLPTSVDGCPYPLNETISMATTMTPIETDLDDKPMILYQITFYYYTTMGSLIVIVVGTIASYFFGVDLESVNPDHITPLMKRFLPPRKYTEVSLKETPSSDAPERSL